MKALCVNGPLRGKHFDSPANHRVFRTISQQGAVSQDYAEPVTYRIDRFRIRSGGEDVVVWLAYTGPDWPTSSEVAEVLLSDAAMESAELMK
jgi:hypothetical protein